MKPTFLICTDTLGDGDEALGALLIRSAVKTMKGLAETPETLLFLNRGVMLCCEGSQLLDDLAELEAAGCRLLCCGTCLDFYHLKEKLKVGTMSNMMDILTAASTSERLVRF